MQFYQVKVKAEEKETPVESRQDEGERPLGRVAAADPEREKTKELIEDIHTQTEEYNKTLPEGEYICFSMLRKVLAVLVVAANCHDRVKEITEEFLSVLNQKYTALKYEDIVYEDFHRAIGRADRGGYIDDSDNALKKLNIQEVDYLDRFGIHFGENMIDCRNRKENEEAAARYMMEESFLPELDRIYAENKKKQLPGHPVHYLLCTDDLETRKYACRTLVSALYEKGRIRNRRYTFTDIPRDLGTCASRLDALYRMNEGGVVVVRYKMSVDEEEDEHAQGEQLTVENLCEVINAFRHKTLTVLCVPRECNKSKEALMKYLPQITFVEIAEDLADSTRAEKYLKMLCREKGLAVDKKLLANLSGDRKYLPSELKNMVELWYDRKIKTAGYPQYRRLDGMKEKLAKEKPKGSAYDELMGMIGLENAKDVIGKALDYFKAQKVFADLGMIREQPCLHCVFTGAPGTAKTSVARLFARILRENRILSKGHLVEVGRSDLVGRYVGWTAKTVKEKFREAEGGVLFIDEAYSLVDDRSGSYGDEAINTIVQEMENRRTSLMVIFAGYSDRMQEFLEKNPGLSSRIAFHVPFDDYRPEELTEIANHICRENRLRLTVGAGKKLHDIFEEACGQEDFGNGRYVRNLLEQAKMAQASRLLKMDLDKVTAVDVTTICEEDIPMPQTENKKEDRRVIGFY